MIVDETNQRIKESLPLTKPTGKIRVKTRSTFYEYGRPFASRQSRFTYDNYVEWQISYDTDKAPSHHASITYHGRGSEKFMTELSFYLYKFCEWGTIRRDDMLNLKACLENVRQENLVANHDRFGITRTRPHETDINGMPFSIMTLKYPQLVYRFGAQGIVAEITIREKQRAVGVQPMFYLCIPIPELNPGRPLIGRAAERNEKAGFVFSEENCSIVLEMTRIFGILSAPHRADMLAIVGRVLELYRD